MKVGIETIGALVDVISGQGSQYAPYRSGPELVEFFNQFGFNEEYGSSFGSRLPFAREMLHKLNNSMKMKAVILAAIDPRRYLKAGFDVEKAVNHIGSCLVFDGYEIYKNGIHYDIKLISGAERVHLNAIKNIIFAANGPKPEIVLVDAIANDIKITKNDEYCLIYDRPIEEHGLLWTELVQWWSEKNGLQNLTWNDRAFKLYLRLFQSLSENSEPEKHLFRIYYNTFNQKLGNKLPALIPQVYLHYDPYTVSQLAGEKRLIRQRMDFLLLLPQEKRIVIEVDGVQHYSKDNKPEPSLYAEMVSEDRRLKLVGYEIYRFGGYELYTMARAEPLVKAFFESLFRRERVEP